MACSSAAVCCSAVVPTPKVVPTHPTANPHVHAIATAALGSCIITLQAAANHVRPVHAGRILAWLPSTWRSAACHTHHPGQLDGADAAYV